MNYGHPLQFGVFLTPSAGDPERVVELAIRAEALGYDLVTVQDHPYQPAHLDAWTLMSWLAGRTTRIGIAANVLNLPLRDPTVLARAAASLDLLSGGRVTLGLGAGHFWDAIAANGGPRHSPGDAVAALDDAITVLRGLLDTSETSPLNFDGEFYRVDGAERGPVAAHDIPIWIGASKPRMLRLVGRRGDGWLPTVRSEDVSNLGARNQIIDSAAIETGRDPREIRRIANISGRFATETGGFLAGPPEAWVRELAPLVAEHGFGTFILMSDDAAVIETFANDVIPALRAETASEIVAAGARQMRRASVRQKRRDQIAYDELPMSLASEAIEPGDPRFANVRSTYMRGGNPGLVLRPGSTEEVVDAIAFARAHPDLPLSRRSGGHGISGRSTNDGGIVIDLSRMNAIQVLDEATRRVRIEPGARWMEVARVLEPHGWALTSGDYGGVGVGGLATAGGLGFLARKHGLTIDHLLAAEIVLADGSVLRTSPEEHAELFWAIRGAGSNFGIVTGFEFEVDAVGQVGWGQLSFAIDDLATFIERWGRVVEEAPRELTAQLIVGRPRPGRPLTAHSLVMVDSDQPEAIIAALEPLAQVAPLIDHRIVITSYANVMANADGGPHRGQGEPVAHSMLVDHFTPEFSRAAAKFIERGAAYWFQVRSAGGAVSDVDPDATAYSGRSANFSLVVMGASRRMLDPEWEELKPFASGMYLSFETDRSVERLHDAFSPEALARLRALKAAYDPENLFRDNFAIAPQPALR